MSTIKATKIETTAAAPMGSRKREDRLMELLGPHVQAAGYEIVAIEVQQQPQSVLRVYIDHLETGPERIGIDDCTRVSHLLDGLLDNMSEVDEIFPAGYELEVSSPGVERPLRKTADYLRFSGKEARIHVYRPLTAEEIENADYQKKNPRQKKFIGILQGLKDEKVLLSLTEETSTSRKKKRSKQRQSGEDSNSKDEQKDSREILIPLELITKANLEPRIDEILEQRKGSKRT